MTLEQQVCSLELAKRLKKLGVKQESIFAYIKTKHTKGIYYVTDAIKPLLSMPDTEWYAAFTVAELGEMLPKHIKGHVLQICPGFNEGGWFAGYGDHMNLNGFKVEDGDTLPDALAKLAIYLIKEGIIEF